MRCQNRSLYRCLLCITSGTCVAQETSINPNRPDYGMDGMDGTDLCLPLTLPYGFHFAYHPGVSEIDLQIALIKADSVDVNKSTHPAG
jgi:hypothetical protein